MNSTARVFKKIIQWAMLVLLPVISCNALHAYVSYQEIANVYLPAFGVLEDNNAHNKQETGRQEDIPKPSLDVKELSKQERRTKVFKLLAKTEDTTDQPSKTVDTLLYELELFCGHSAHPAHTVVSHIKRTITSFGEAVLTHMIANPTTNTQQIEARQTLVRHLLSDKALRNDIEAILDQVSHSESAFLANWQEEDRITKDTIASLYFGKWFAFLNNNSYALEAKIRARNLNSCIPLIDPFIIACFPYLADREAGFISALKKTFVGYKDAYNPFAYAKEYNHYFTEEFKQVCIEQNSEEAIQKLSDQLGIALPVPSEDEVLAQVEQTKKYAAYGLALKAFAVAGYTYIKYNQCNNAATVALQQHKGHTYLQTKLLGLARILNAVEAINELIPYHSELQHGLLYSNNIEYLLHGKDNPRVQAFIATLRTRTFKRSPSFFSRMGRVLAAAKQAEDLKDELIPLIEIIGELDACLSIAKLIEEHETSTARYCFAQFVQNDTPYIQLEEFWHPYLGKEQVVTNTIELGAQYKERNIILTGSNTGGKSTLLKAIGINLLLAHTIGIAPSSSAILTPFACINSSLHLSDNTAAGISLFKAEVLRARQIMDQVSRIPNNAYAFLIIDEMFTGTNAQNGADAARSFASTIAQHPHVLYIFATHFPLVTTLEPESNGLCANYCMDIYKDEHGNLQPTYQLAQGISTQNIAEDILEEELGTFL